MADNKKTTGNRKTADSKGLNVKVIVGIAALAAAVVLFTAVFFAFREKPVEGSKTIVIEVVDNEQKRISYNVKTDAEYLRQAMEEAEGLEFSGTESEYGMMVSIVNGVTADYNVNGAYWSFSVNGGYCNYGIDTQPVLDGDIFCIEYTPAQ